MRILNKKTEPLIGYWQKWALRASQIPQVRDGEN